MPTPKKRPSAVAPPAVVTAGDAAPPPGEPSPRRRPSVVLRRERERVAQVLHNTVCQDLTGISLMANAAARQYRTVCPEAEQKLKELAGLVQNAGLGLQEFLRSLRPED